MKLQKFFWFSIFLAIDVVISSELDEESHALQDPKSLNPVISINFNSNLSWHWTLKQAEAVPDFDSSDIFPFWGFLCHIFSFDFFATQFRESWWFRVRRQFRKFEMGSLLILTFLFGFVFGVVAIVGAEAFGIFIILNKLSKRSQKDLAKANAKLDQSELDPLQSLEFLSNKQVFNGASNLGNM